MLGSKLAIALTATSSALALLLVIAMVVFIVRKNVPKKRRGTFFDILDVERLCLDSGLNI